MAAKFPIIRPNTLTRRWESSNRPTVPRLKAEVTGHSGERHVEVRLHAQKPGNLRGVQGSVEDIHLLQQLKNVAISSWLHGELILYIYTKPYTVIKS